MLIKLIGSSIRLLLPIIINKTSGQIIDFYEVTSLNGFINIRKVQ